jgi:hypothetical protein
MKGKATAWHQGTGGSVKIAAFLPEFKLAPSLRDAHSRRVTVLAAAHCARKAVVLCVNVALP